LRKGGLLIKANDCEGGYIPIKKARVLRDVKQRARARDETYLQRSPHGKGGKERVLNGLRMGKGVSTTEWNSNWAFTAA